MKKLNFDVTTLKNGFLFNVYDDEDTGQYYAKNEGELQKYIKNLCAGKPILQEKKSIVKTSLEKGDKKAVEEIVDKATTSEL